MGAKSNIEWTDRTWNPWHGCHKISQGCKNCYMFREKKRYGQDPNIVVRSKTTFRDPLSWPKERALCFTCSWSDWFIEEADDWRAEAYEVIRATPWITYQILTKRIERAAGRLTNPLLPNVWWGVSVEDNSERDRIDELMRLRVAKRFISYEPALGELDLTDYLGHHLGCDGEVYPCSICESKGRLDWVIVGGESGPGARPAHPDWFRSARDQCIAAGVSFFFKQWGEWEIATGGGSIRPGELWMAEDGRTAYPSSHALEGAASVYCMRRVGKKAAGAMLDGREWREFPEVR